jgi:uncharacterized protein
MQEVLVRGYLYQMIKNNYNIVVAVLISTGLFTFAHGGAFEAGILPVLNVITMSLFVTSREYRNLYREQYISQTQDEISGMEK